MTCNIALYKHIKEVCWYSPLNSNFALDHNIDNAAGTPFLAWLYSKHICFYGIDGVGSDIILPWLPFDITPDRLKLLLVFS